MKITSALINKFLDCRGVTIVGLTLIVGAIALASCASTPPTKLEQGIFTIETNYTPVLVVRTNFITQTNLVTVTRTNVVEQPGGATITNVVTVPVPQLVTITNVVTATNLVESYVYKPGTGSTQVTQIGGEVGGLFGAGGLVTTALGALFSIWGWVRSSKNNAAAVNLAQTVETVREFLKTLPNGNTYDTVLTQWMQQHQAESGVLTQVLSLLQKDVSNPDAKVAAQQVILALQALSTTSQPPSTKV